jgi:hypothetical protein
LAALDLGKQLLVAEISGLTLDGGDRVQARVVREETLRGSGVLGAD